MKRLLLSALGFVAVGCQHIDRAEPVAPVPVEFRITQRSLDEFRDTLPSWLIPQGGSYIVFEAEAFGSTSKAPHADQVRLAIECSLTSLEPGEECIVKVTLLGGAPGSSYRVTLLVPDELTIRGPSIFVMESGGSRVLMVVSHARTTARILARVQRISEGIR